MTTMGVRAPLTDVEILTLTGQLQERVADLWPSFAARRFTDRQAAAMVRDLEPICGLGALLKELDQYFADKPDSRAPKWTTIKGRLVGRAIRRRREGMAAKSDGADGVREYWRSMDRNQALNPWGREILRIEAEGPAFGGNSVMPADLINWDDFARRFALYAHYDRPRPGTEGDERGKLKWPLDGAGARAKLPKLLKRARNLRTFGPATVQAREYVLGLLQEDAYVLGAGDEQSDQEIPF